MRAALWAVVLFSATLTQLACDASARANHRASRASTAPYSLLTDLFSSATSTPIAVVTVPAAMPGITTVTPTVPPPSTRSPAAETPAVPPLDTRSPAATPPRSPLVRSTLPPATAVSTRVSAVGSLPRSQKHRPRPINTRIVYSPAGDACDYTCTSYPPVDLPVDITEVILDSDGETLRIIIQAVTPIVSRLPDGAELFYHLLIHDDTTQVSINMRGASDGWTIWGVDSWGQVVDLPYVQGEWGEVFTVTIPWDDLEFVPDAFWWALQAIWRERSGTWFDITPETVFPGRMPPGFPG